MKRHVLTTPIAATAALLCFAAPPLRAADRFWVTPAGGAFGIGLNWSATDGGAGGAGAPGAVDLANFTLANTYPVLFGADFSVAGIQVEDGNVTLDLNGHTLTTATATIEVGTVSGQTGRLTVSDGALEMAGSVLRVGTTTGSTGFLTVTTDGSFGDGAFTPSLYIGEYGAGTLAITANGRVEGDFIRVGGQSVSTGTVTVTGATASLVSNSITIGSFGDGALIVAAGGQATTNGDIRLGENAAGVGNVSVTGAGSRWTTGSTSTDEFTLGRFGQGTMLVANGGEVVTPFNANLGDETNSAGSVTITGAGSRWDLAGSLTVADSGNGDLTISSGGAVSVAGNLIIAKGVPGTGEVTVTGAGSRLDVDFDLHVASNGSGTLNVLAGAVVTTGRVFWLQYNDPSNEAVLNLDGGLIEVGDHFINDVDSNFSHTNGTLRVFGSYQVGSVGNHLIVDGDDSSDLPVVDLVGSGNMVNLLQISVGVDNRGLLLLRQGRVVNTGTSNIIAGLFAGGEGTISVLSGSQLSTSAVLSLGGFTSTSGLGTLNITDSTVNAGSVQVKTGSVINLSNATLQAATITSDGLIATSSGTASINGSLIQNAGATLTTAGGATTTISGNLAHNGAEVFTALGASTVILGTSSGAGPFTGFGTVSFMGGYAPGNSAALVTHAGGVLLGPASTTTMEIGGLTRGTQHDAVNVAGTLTLGGTLSIQLINSFAPALGNVFNLFDSGAVAGGFSTVNLPALATGLIWNQANLSTAGELQIALDPAVVSRTWDGAGPNNDWSTDSNWDPNVEPLNNGTAALIFPFSVESAPSVDTPWSVNSITFTSSANAYTITGPQGITTGAGGITNNDTQTQTIDAAITLGATQSFTAAAGDLDVESIAFAGYTLALAGANDITLGSASGSGGIKKNSTGDLDITGALGTGGIVLSANAGDTEFHASQTLAALTIANGATVTLDSLPPFPPALAPVPEPGVGALLSGAVALLTSRRPRRHRILAR